MRPHSRLTGRQSKRFIEKRNNRTIITVVLFLFCLALFIYALMEFTKLPFLTISNITVHGADADIMQALESSAGGSLQGKYLGIFDRANTLIYPKAALVNAIKESSARIESVKVARNGTEGLDITVTEKAPAALVCPSLPDFSGSSLALGDTDTCYFADSTGYIYEQAPSYSGNVYNRYYIPGLSDDSQASSTEGVIGSYATSTSEFANLQKFYDSIQAGKIFVDAILLKDGGEYELYARNAVSKAPVANGAGVKSAAASQTGTVGEPGYISSTTPEEIEPDSDTVVVYFNNARPFSEELANLLTFWNKETVGANPPQFESIDVRFGPNVYYRKL